MWDTFKEGLQSCSLNHFMASSQRPNGALFFLIKFTVIRTCITAYECTQMLILSISRCQNTLYTSGMDMSCSPQRFGALTMT